jgi:hypothetical protein
MRGGLIDFFREADWLNGQRVRGYAALIGIASLALLTASWFKAQGPEGSDFLAFWGSARAVLAGLPQAAYDLPWQEHVQTRAGFTGWYAFVNPPPFLFVIAPFGLLSVPAGWIAWVAVTYAAWAWVGVRAFPRLWPLVEIAKSSRSQKRSEMFPGCGSNSLGDPAVWCAFYRVACGPTTHRCSSMVFGCATPERPKAMPLRFSEIFFWSIRIVLRYYEAPGHRSTAHMLQAA